MVFMNRVLIALTALASASACAAPPPLVIAHRGASGHLPEHTLEAYRLAIDMGADYIEPDLVATKDAVLIARHENEMSETTDVALKFPDRKRAKTIEGRAVEGWFSEDFTIAEIRTLRARERLASRGHGNDGKFAIPTLSEILALAIERGVGVYPETKHSSYFRSIGLPLEPPLLAALKSAGLDRAEAKVFIQSFEVDNLKALKAETPVRLVQLLGNPKEQPADRATMTYGDMLTPAGFAAVARYAAGVGPPKAMATAEFVVAAHAAGLVVHPYTFRSDAPFLGAEYKGDPAAEYCRFFALGVDGVFSDFPDHALTARDKVCPGRGR
jgi:glycerophosphoryl diester phosphodiesterase